MNVVARRMEKVKSVVELSHHSIFDKKASNPMNATEHFFRIGYYLAEIDKILNFLGHICIILGWFKNAKSSQTIYFDQTRSNSVGFRKKNH